MPPRTGGNSINEAFDPRRNALNAVRLGLATGVMLLHSFPLSGHHLPAVWLQVLMGDGFVDGFFALSGFLIVGSWHRRPRVGAFLKARTARILPAFWVCLLVTAFLIIPLSVAAAGGSWKAVIASGGSWGYVKANAFLRIRAYGIPGVWDSLPYPSIVNGSLWTLFYEFVCYLIVLALGFATLLRRRHTLLIAFAASWVFNVAVMWGAVTDNYDAKAMARFALMFFTGGLLYRYGHRIPASWGLVGISVLIVVASAVWSPDYRTFASIPLGYALLVTGTKVKQKALSLDNDISYGVYIYAFPFQQLLASTGFQLAGPLVYFVVAMYMTFPAALASWFLIEKPILDRVRRGGLRSQPQVMPIVQARAGPAQASARVPLVYSPMDRGSET